ncbi:MAG: hypothetical protein UY96_C0017G0034 [Parcubacteria group bacterium GW2011_GWB1_56_8]|nr:MAG: hypothetical protein UY96_C0017G0034 [Parcubacteria group bacterium GW2011_GWB1_56_8]
MYDDAIVKMSNGKPTDGANLMPRAASFDLETRLAAGDVNREGSFLAAKIPSGVFDILSSPFLARSPIHKARLGFVHGGVKQSRPRCRDVRKCVSGYSVHKLLADACGVSHSSAELNCAYEKAHGKDDSNGASAGICMF